MKVVPVYFLLANSAELVTTSIASVLIVDDLFYYTRHCRSLSH